MELIVHGKHLDVGDALRTHMKDKMEDINEKYFNRAIDSTITIGPEGGSQYKVHISMRVGKDILVQSTVIAGDPYGAFDQAAEKVAKQLRRYKKRLRDHHERLEEIPGEAPGFLIKENVIAPEKQDDSDEKEEEVLGDGEPVIVAEMTRNIQKMTVSEAVMRMDLAGESAMLFRNSKADGLNMVYKRSDGNIGWVDPESSKAQAAE